MPAEKIIFDRTENNKIVWLTKNKQEIITPKSLTPSAKEGDAYYLTISPNRTETENKQEQAKQILNEILNTDD